jgi:tetratricopeptide (TPR) repeat protein
MSKEEREFHRRMGSRCFNEAWDILDKRKRTQADNLQMLHLAHASRYHWSIVGTPTNRAVGDWQLSRIYAELGEPELALAFANICLSECRENGLSEIEHTAHEAIARSYAVAKDYRSARKHLGTARRMLDRLSLSKEDRAVYMEQIKNTSDLVGSGR